MPKLIFTYRSNHWFCSWWATMYPRLCQKKEHAKLEGLPSALVLSLKSNSRECLVGISSGLINQGMFHIYIYISYKGSIMVVKRKVIYMVIVYDYGIIMVVLGIPMNSSMEYPSWGFPGATFSRVWTLSFRSATLPSISLLYGYYMVNDG